MAVRQRQDITLDQTRRLVPLTAGGGAGRIGRELGDLIATCPHGLRDAVWFPAQTHRAPKQ